jgi:hypothetical protein
LAKTTQVRHSFTDVAAKLRKGMPNMCTYKHVDNGMRLIGRECLSTSKL